MTDHHYYGDRILPDGITSGMGVAELIDGAFLAYNGGKVQRACQMFATRVLEEDVTVGLSLSGALTPAGVGQSCVIPMIQNGFVDWIVSTGANLYHDLHFGLGQKLFRGSERLDDVELRRKSIIRIYDVLFDYENLLDTDAYMRDVLAAPEFNRTMGTAELHYLLGKYLAKREEELGLTDSCILTVAFRHAVPCYVSSPGDSSIGLNVAELALRERGPRIDVSLDVNETSGFVYDAKQSGGKHAAVIFGGGSPKNFLLQTEPQIQEVLGIQEWGHDYYLQFTDARPDTGGLSGATPSEAVSWGKVDPRKLPDTVTAYCDTTIAAPLLVAYALERAKPRKPKRLYERRREVVSLLLDAYKKAHPGGSFKRSLRRPDY